MGYKKDGRHFLLWKAGIELLIVYEEGVCSLAQKAIWS